MYRITALYQFAHFPDFESYKEPILERCQLLQLKGTLLLAQEGINGTLAGTSAAIDRLLDYLNDLPAFDAITHKSSCAENLPFLRMKVKLKQEIVTLGVPGLDPQTTVGTYVKPEDWNALIQDPAVTIIDTRNNYEVAIGTFAGAINPKTNSFRQFPDYVAANLDPQQHKKVAMFCTGGIRCEKSTAFLLAEGFEEVYHLQGGILKYLEKVPASESLWQGDCFVFDDRVTVQHDLTPGDYDMCHACRRPLKNSDKHHAAYKPGVACHYCVLEKTPEQREAYQERQNQIELAQQRNQPHLGATLKS